MRTRLRDHWAWIPVLAFYAAAAAVYLAAGEHAQIAVSDNLDLFQSQYQMLRLTDTFYAQDASALFLNGISRDVLPSEFSLTSLLYQIFPPLVAYELLYFVKITIAIVSFSLLAGELDHRGLLKGPAGCGKEAARPENCGAAGGIGTRAVNTAGGSPARWNLAVLCGLAYGVLNLFPSFGICFASIPLFLWLVLRLEGEPRRSRCCLWLLGILLYPWLSYFSYFGFFLIAYLCGAFLFKSIVDSVCGRRIPGFPEAVSSEPGAAAGDPGAGPRRGFHPDLRLLAAVIVLSAGTAACEYRLFSQMLFADEVTIRETMVQSSLGFVQILRTIGNVFLNGVDMHCESVHKWIVLPVCLAYLVILNAGYVRRHEVCRIGTDVYNLAFLTLLFNCAVYGFYYCEPFRSFIEMLLPPLTGFQFNRTAFFNPFLWYGMFFLALYRMLLWLRERKDRFAAAPWVLVFAATAVILLSGTTYNDLLNTAKSDVKRLLGMEQSDELDYAEFYSTELFEEILEDIGYEGEWAVAYGLHPAVLNYSGISTLDGYLGFYSQEYKEAFREVIAPALEENEATRIYYDDWGARCYLYSGHNTTIVEAVRHYTHAEDTIDIDADALLDLGCTYIFSRIHLTNADEKGLTLFGTYTHKDSPYTIYLYLPASF